MGSSRDELTPGQRSRYPSSGFETDACSETSTPDFKRGKEEERIKMRREAKRLALNQWLAEPVNLQD